MSSEGRNARPGLLSSMMVMSLRRGQSAHRLRASRSRCWPPSRRMSKEIGPAHAYRQAPFRDDLDAWRASLGEQVTEAEMPEVDSLLLLALTWLHWSRMLARWPVVARHRSCQARAFEPQTRRPAREIAASRGRARARDRRGRGAAGVSGRSSRESTLARRQRPFQLHSRCSARMCPRT
jgi:hypothetical protein